MANECLVTKLKGTVQNDNLPKLGYAQVKITSVTDQESTPSKHYVQLRFSQAATLYIIGDGYFTDATMQQNYGKELSLSANDPHDVYYSDGNFQIELPKYTLMRFDCQQSPIEVDLTDFYGIPSNFRAYINFGGVTKGNIEVLGASSNIVEFYLPNNTTQVSGLYGDFTKAFHNQTNIDGFNGLDHLQNVECNLLEHPDFVWVGGELPRVTGDIVALMVNGGYSSRDIAMSCAANSEVYGDISLLQGTIRFIKGMWSANPNNHFTYKHTRSADTKILAIEGGLDLGEDLDAYFINQAQCTKAFVDGDYDYYKTISVRGTRTSASDSAVAALKALGYRIYVNGVAL